MAKVSACVSLVASPHWVLYINNVNNYKEVHVYAKSSFIMVITICNINSKSYT